MELLDRYLQAVKKHLPWRRQDDIVAEMRANLESQLEDKEQQLGRPLTTGEAEDWLRLIGPPKQVAALYQPQQYLIGPTVFPTYKLVMRIALLWALAIYTIARVVQIAVQNPTGTSLSGAVLSALLGMPGILLTTVAWITLIFAAIEFAVVNYPEQFPWLAAHSANWSPSTLPPLAPDSVPGKKRRSYAQAVAEVVFGFIFLVWLLLIPQHPYVLMGPGIAFVENSPFQLSSGWIQFFWLVVAANGLQLLWHCVNLWRGTWQQRHPWQQVAMKTLGLFPIVWMLSYRDHAYLSLKHPALDQARFAGALETINNGIYLGTRIICAIVVLQLIWTLAQAGISLYRHRAPGRVAHT